MFDGLDNRLATRNEGYLEYPSKLRQSLEGSPVGAGKEKGLSMMGERPYLLGKSKYLPGSHSAYLDIVDEPHAMDEAHPKTSLGQTFADIFVYFFDIGGQNA